MKRNGMKNLCRFLAVLPLRACSELAEGVRGSQTCPPNKSFGRRGELRTLPPSTDSRLPVVFICLPAPVRRPPRLANIKDEPTKRIVRILTTKRQPASPRLAQINGNPTKRIVCTLVVKCAGGNRLTYEKELLNSRKNSYFYKTNHPGFPHRLPPYDPNNNIVRIYAPVDKCVEAS